MYVSASCIMSDIDRSVSERLCAENDDQYE